jgi:plastocyanin
MSASVQRRRRFIDGADGAFANVLVNLDGSFPNAPAPTAPAVLSQKDCQYAPRVVGARIGQTLQVKNEDPTEHNVHSLSKAGNEFNTNQPDQQHAVRVQAEGQRNPPRYVRQPHLDDRIYRRHG